MGFNQQLYNELYTLRQRLKDDGRWSNGRAPIVCTDEALFEIVRLLPQKISDFTAVSGLGKTFIEQYAEIFLKTILKHSQASTAKGLQMNSTTSSTLKELEKKLVSINRRNRLLHMSRIVNKYAFDLFDTPIRYDLQQLLFGKGKSMVVCDVKEPSSVRGQSGEDKYRKIVQLIREVNKDMRDKGHYDLFVGYPFVQGRLAGENFDIKAPLALFPVVVEREAQYIKIQLDDTRDAIFNNTLVLAHMKFNNINRSLPNAVIDEVSPETFIQNVNAFYKENGIELIDANDELNHFIEYRANEFPKYQCGELHLVRNIVLGKFPTYSSSIQKDFNDIIDKNEINSLVNDLLLEPDDIDYYSDNFSGETEICIADKPLEISEEALFYINELNSAQEAVLTATEKLDELVVQGPPGTGKSQTITSLISEFVSAGKTVLMVSEKKTALDVVYSRLGDLSRYALMIDDVGNKDLFYQQLDRMLHLGGRQFSTVDLQQLSRSIDDNVARLERIAQQLYAINEFGIEPYKLYLMNDRIDLANPAALIKYKENKAIIPETLLSVNYSELEAMHTSFADITLSNNLSLLA